ncbi:UBE2Z-like protein [Mya arenaria]|uniref:Ubiquitin-conjugating enzyme E2 Z n=1 Tax=Mya arenaria TaxID=6604 RepID=A0ABY7E2E6_MYAAR|nr:UBE2Z-like protein [Mya arenaria]
MASANTEELDQPVDLLSFVEDSGGGATALWDPDLSNDWEKEKPKSQCILHALITGPFDTPYEGGFFYFLIRCPPDYPIRPPRVKLQTTGGGRVRFNPNLYRNGKVCLSIIGTWSGPAWSPAQSLSSVLISIQSLLNEKPYHNEPGFHVERNAGDAKRYNDIIRHETLRVGVCDMLEKRCACPVALREVMEKSFPDYYDYYVGICKSNMHKQGETMQDPFGERRGTYDYENILKRLENIHKTVSDKLPSSDTESSDTDLESSTSER